MQVGDLVTRDSSNFHHYRLFGIIVDVDPELTEVWGTMSPSYQVKWNDETMSELEQNQWYHSRFLAAV